MFKITGPGLSPDELKQAQFEAARNTEFPEYDPQSDLSPKEWARLKEHWETFKEPVRDPKKFCVAMKLDQDEEHYAVLHYRAGKKLRITVEDKQSIQEFSGLFPIFPEFVQRKGVKTVPPNKPCPCGSGKKAKKCCGT